MKTILLASGSPRRAELLGQLRIPFEVVRLDNDDAEGGMDVAGLEPGALAERIAVEKLRNAQPRVRRGNAIVLCADTIVVAGGEILGKPRDADHAKAMLRALSGARHEVITGVALQDTDTGFRVVFHESTGVVFRELDGSEIRAYAASGEPLDKAGAYGIQGLAGAFVTRVDGCYSNVVGLPLGRLAAILKSEFGCDVTENW